MSRYELFSPAGMSRIMKKHGFRNAHSLGQNFLTDEGVIDGIIFGSDIAENDLVIEIGPGLGVLTAGAAEEAEKVIAIEIDKRLIPILKDTLSYYDNIEIVNEDIMKIDLHELIREHKTSGNVRVIGNLPYYITTPILMKLLEERVPAESFTVMMQKEVAERIMAEPGGRTFGALTVAVSYYCTATLVAEAPKEMFIPQPKVDSAVVRLDRRKEPAVKPLSEKVFFETVKFGFGKRRKTLQNSITGARGINKEEAGLVLDRAGVARNRRAETLTLEEFAAVADEIVRLKELPVDQAE